MYIFSLNFLFQVFSHEKLYFAYVSEHSKHLEIRSLFSEGGLHNVEWDRPKVLFLGRSNAIANVTRDLQSSTSPLFLNQRGGLVVSLRGRYITQRCEIRVRIPDRGNVW